MTRPCVPPTPGKAYMSPVYNICETNDGVCLTSVAQQCKRSRCSRPGAGSGERSFVGVKLSFPGDHATLTVLSSNNFSDHNNNYITTSAYAVWKLR